MNKSGVFITAFLLFLILPVVSADAIVQGYKSISVNNVITNMADFKDYYIISTCPIGMGMPKVIDDSGVISAYYKFCSLEIYAVKKASFNLTLSTDEQGKLFFDLQKNNYTEQNFESYLNSNGAVKLAEKIKTSDVVQESSPATEINSSYTLSLNSVKSFPDENNTAKADYSFLYWIISIMAIVAIIIILIGRSKR